MSDGGEGRLGEGLSGSGELCGDADGAGELDRGVGSGEIFSIMREKVGWLLEEGLVHVTQRSYGTAAAVEPPRKRLKTVASECVGQARIDVYLTMMS